MNKKTKHSSTFWKKVISWLKEKIPLGICGLFFLFSFTPTTNNAITQKLPLFFLPFFYWLTKRPESIGLIYLVIIGFMYDIIDNNFFGINMFLIILMYACFMYQKFIPTYKNFITSYMTFISIMFVYYLIKYILFIIIFDTSPTILNVFINYSTMVLLYPPTYFLLEKINKKLFYPKKK